ncbi:hypothetical protein JST97_18520 [bacterium]|nr:hypothetical protein [bacterium]
MNKNLVILLLLLTAASLRHIHVVLPEAPGQKLEEALTELMAPKSDREETLQFVSWR